MTEKARGAGVAHDQEHCTSVKGSISRSGARGVQLIQATSVAILLQYEAKNEFLRW